ncbi:choice-of-anchor E domain-containing protein [Capilliphycus salinus ALCB114379]|uniref:PEP-CTERM sorting domain-containing protein n=1 Tax=Capilliphycus salinus TaxID=2768948 RepID=UPI0039A4BC74
MINQFINPKLIAGLTTVSTLTGLMLTDGAANAATMTKSYTDSFGLATTDIEDAMLSVQKFDSSLGILKSVKVTFDGQIVGNAKVENLDAKDQTLTFDLSGNLQLMGPDALGTLFDKTANKADSLDASAYDGTFDFAGTSGGMFTGLTASASGEKTYTDQSILSAFMGDGNIDFLFSAFTNSKVTGSANIVSQINTQGGAMVSVVYEYEKAQEIPEPSVMLGLGLVAGAGWLSRKKQASSN